MRPEILYPLFASLETLPGVGPRTAKTLREHVGATVADFCWHLPGGLIDRRYAPAIADAEPGRVATLKVRVEQHHTPRSSRSPYRVQATDGTGTLFLVFFHANRNHLTRILPPGEERAVSGRLEVFGGRLQMSHPDDIVPVEAFETLKRVEPVYPLTAGLPPKTLAKAIAAAVERAPALPEWLDSALVRREAWSGWKESLAAAHAPGEEGDLDPTAPARRRLAYDELLANQLALALIRRQQKKRKGTPLKGDGHLRAQALTSLPFRLTGSQERAVAEILTDMAGASRMLRLLQGDVGSGKTVVALLALLNAVECGAQAVLMAPTEILARQHMKTVAPIALAAGVRTELLTGREKGRARKDALDRLASGSSGLAIGTHALFQKDVAFRSLGLIVIDEQHRFGVHQRLLLAGKGEHPDILVMTATPIPRTLMLTSYGDMDNTRLTEKPAGRKPVETRAMPLERLDEIARAIDRVIGTGARVYWICPLVEASETLDLAAAEARYEDLKSRSCARIGLVHGRMKGDEREAAMTAFAAGEIDLLVATTVVEVGVDVPEASVMVIEHAERFGLAQLHQLRGRVGRGGQASSCILLYQGPLTRTARERLEVMRRSEDGFLIAEKDLELRGAGELLGTRQSGLPQFRLADPVCHGDLMAMADDDANLILDRDPELASERGQAVRALLYLFERDATVAYLGSG